MDIVRPEVEVKRLSVFLSLIDEGQGGIDKPPVISNVVSIGILQDVLHGAKYDRVSLGPAQA